MKLKYKVKIKNAFITKLIQNGMVYQSIIGILKNIKLKKISYIQKFSESNQKYNN